ncbi:hypothetical protein Xvie_04048 [Xenorhabdus vietnamensis]|uniref:Uncharacterized protein n=1 Tax=Xenorhabdus vietnamensis TaxID=351656 RepID=A0A1Y2S925_9GAMM|nr:hypothetical protein Xvie_04048 [Xenorhabdus vietnamensis]
MAKRKRSKTQQGYMGMTIPQGMRLGRNEKQDYLNSKNTSLIFRQKVNSKECHSIESCAV